MGEKLSARMSVGASKHLLTNVIFLVGGKFCADIVRGSCGAPAPRMLDLDWGLNLPAHRVSRVGQAFKSQKNTFKCVKLTFCCCSN